MSLLMLALIVGFVLIAGSLGLVGLRSYELWRTSRGFLRELAESNGALVASLERLSSFEAGGGDRLSTSIARLEASRARLDVLTDALGRVHGQWASLVGLYPKK